MRAPSPAVPALAIELRAAAKSYARPGGAAYAALSDVSLEIRPGEFVAVLGKSGSGKSTLLNLIAGLDRASSGDVRVAGADIGGMHQSALARWRGRNVGVVFQFFQLLPTLTALENVMIAMELVGSVPPAERRAHARALLESLDLGGQAHKLPSTLSGGQQQRVAIARALANAPPLLLADEPTGNLDTQSAAGINALLRSLAERGTTLLVVTHDRSLSTTAHRVVELTDGRVTADSAP